MFVVQVRTGQMGGKPNTDVGGKGKKRKRPAVRRAKGEGNPFFLSFTLGKRRTDFCLGKGGRGKKVLFGLFLPPQ